MAGGDLLGISSSGVIAAQRALTTTGHNIANSTTPGFSRQRTDMQTREPQFAGNGTIGTGVIVDNVSRYYDEFLTSEVRGTTSLSKLLDKSYDYTRQVDDLLADPEAGLAPVMSQFFDSVNGLANDPASTSARQVMLSAGRNLSDRFAYMNSRLESLRTATNQDMRSMVGQVNELAKGIAQLNNSIVRAREITQKPANDLLDQRDRLVQQLSELINVKTTIQDDDRMNVFIGNGQTLVVGDSASELDITINEYDPTQTEVVFVGNGENTVITRFLSGGELGGITKFREEILDPAHNELGRIAIGIAQTFNQQHRLGMDLNNELGKDFFKKVDLTGPLVLPSKNNQGDMQLGLEITDTDKLTTSNYQLSFIQGQYELLRLEDAKVVGKFTNLPQTIETDGMRLNVTAGSTIQEGDKFLIQPTRRAADLFDVQLHSVAEIAASSPVRVESDIDNLGEAQIQVTQITSVDTPSFQGAVGQLSPPYVVRFVDSEHFEILDNSGKPVKVKMAATADAPSISLNGVANREAQVKSEAEDDEHYAEHSDHRVRDDKQSTSETLGVIAGPIPYDARKGAELFPTEGGIDRGFHIMVNGKPKAGDMFRIEFNTDGTSDNTNALQLAGLQTRPSLMNGTSDYAQTYGQLVSRVGSRTHELDINRQAQQLLMNQAIEAREELSGVNLDEEAAQLIRYQNLYQANAQVIATANQTFQILMDAFR